MKMAERILALDVGDRRIGVAVSDGLGITAQPVGMIKRIGWGPDIQKINEYAAQYDTRHILCGLPRNMDGSYGAQAEKVRDFAQQLEKSGFDLSFWDERMSTITAERVLIEGGVRRQNRKMIIDQTAAVVILQAFLDAENQKKQGDRDSAERE